MNLPIINSLTSIRFFAALVVILSHVGAFMGIKSSNPLVNEIFFKKNEMGVFFSGLGIPLMSLFFILTGFLMAYNYEHKIINKQLSLKYFLILRFARIYPTYLLTLLLAIPLVIYGLTIPVNNYNSLPQIDSLIFLRGFIDLFLLQSYIPNYYCILNPPSWTLSVDVLFYSLFGLLILIDKRKLQILTVILLIVIGTAWFFVIPTQIPKTMPIIAISFMNPILRLVDFLIGIVLSRIFIALLAKPINNKILFNFLELGVILLYLAFFFFALKFKVHQLYIRDLYYLLPMGLMVFIFAFQKGFISKMLQNKYLILLGNASFAIYLIHWLVISYGIFLIEHFNISITSSSQVLLTLFLVIFITIICSLLSYIYFEQPMNIFIRKSFSAYKTNKKTQGAIDSMYRQKLNLQGAEK